jgi:hypothetical protein
MDELLTYINSLSGDERTSFAARCMTTEGYLRKAVSTKQKLGTALSVLIEKESGGAVTSKHLHDDWAQMWPELVDAA